MLKWYEVLKKMKHDGPVEREERLVKPEEKEQKKFVSRRRLLQNCREV